MKLSAAVLALAGSASAEYACCPYDDWGLVEPMCVSELTDKTHFGDGQEGACKAWGANPYARECEDEVVHTTGAPYTTPDGGYEEGGYRKRRQAYAPEGEDPETTPVDCSKWGGCGYHRNFPWTFPADGALGITSANYQNFLISKDGTSAPNFNVFDETGAGGASNRAPPVYGDVILGGICKLFIPVKYEHIEYVNIAGVHWRGGGFRGAPRPEAIPTIKQLVGGVDDFSIYDAAVTNADASMTMFGTAFCFSVVNPSECMVNANGIHNGNVAGLGPDNAPLLDVNNDVVGDWDDSHPSIQFDYPNVSPDYPQFGDKCLDDGALETEFPPPPVNDNPEDGYDEGGDGYEEYRKRRQAGSYAVLEPDEIPQPDNIVVEGPNFDVVVHFNYDWCASHWSSVNMQNEGEHGFDNLDTEQYKDGDDQRFNADSSLNGYSGTPGLNTYNLGMTTHKWPNAGAWAAYYSFVTCSHDGAGGYQPIHGNMGRRAVIGGMNIDFRHAHGSVTVRGNVRQVGTEVVTCAPGDVPSDGSRCTWNWNFVDQSQIVDDTAFTGGPDRENQGSPSLDFVTVDIKVEPRTPGTAADWAEVFVTGDVCRSDHAENACTNNDDGTFTISLQCEQQVDGNGDGNPGDGNAAKDLFPTCFSGDEVHFEWSKPASTSNIQLVQDKYSGVELWVDNVLST